MLTIGSSPLRIASRLVAVWLVVLIAVPFTAPFRTLDLAALADGVQTHESLNEKLTTDAIVSAPSVDHGPPAPASCCLVEYRFRLADHAPQRLVLRL